MKPRRVALALAVALAAASSAIGAIPARASSSSTICVALVVDGRSIGSDVSTTCATVDKGANGLQVLRAGGHSMTFRGDGLLCTIDGLPTTGCTAVDDTHYWAYYHRAPGATAWTYSNEGAATYQPINASTEGWVYEDGTSITPENVPYSQICKTKATPKPTPTKTTQPKPTHSPKPATSHHTPAPAATSATPTPTRSLGHRHKTHHRPNHHRHIYSQPPIHNPPAPASTNRTQLVGAGANEAPTGGHGGLESILALVVIALLGGAAWWKSRRPGWHD